MTTKNGLRLLLLITTVMMTVMMKAGKSSPVSTPSPAPASEAGEGMVCETDEGDEVMFGERRKMWVNSSCHACTCTEEVGLTCTALHCLSSCSTNPSTSTPTQHSDCCSNCPDEWCRDVEDDSVIEGLRPGRRLQRQCRVCYCGPRGDAHCGDLVCDTPLCSNPTVPDGGCCPRCLDGNNCVIQATGEILEVGKRVQMEGVGECECPDPESPTLLRAATRKDFAYTANCTR